jgi:Txe/YoeB family toxin of Txe-Axe toxin-antitoxin module
MEIEFSPTALKDLSLIKRSYSNASKNKLTRILQSIEETPFSGLQVLKH